MTETIRIYDNGKHAGDISVNEISEMLGGKDGSFENEYMQRDFDNMMTYLRSQSISPNETAVDISKLLSGSQLDAPKTNAVFWLTALLMKNGMLRKLSPATAMKMIPFIAAKTKAAELKSKSTEKDIDIMLKFTRTYTACAKKIAADECSADEAAQMLYSVLPSERLARSEAKVRPQVLDVLRSSRQLGEMCSEPDIRQKMQDYFDKISDIL